MAGDRIAGDRMPSAGAPFLGTGWSFPPTFSQRTWSVVMVSGEDDIRESLRILFSTALGERIMVPEYGCDLSSMVFRSITTTLQTELEAGIRQAILSWEPRIDVLDVTVQRDATVDGLILVAVDYVIRRTNTRSNLVYPFYVREGTLVPAA
jgi:phage baseplate assembly protein W